MSKRELYIFNPDNDLALANGEANYMPPASAQQMASDLALLPAWYAAPGSAVLAPSAYNLVFLREMQRLLPIPVDLMTAPELASDGQFTPVPWGWNPSLRKKLLLAGVEEEGLPSLEHIAELRRLSHRMQVVELLPRLQLNEYFCGESHYLTRPEEWQSFVEEHKSSLLKAPLSGSGKGLNWCKGMFTSSISGWCKRIAALQGGIMAEPVYDKVIDFAMEFCSDGLGKVRFVGYSVFATNRSGAYEGNVLQSDEQTRRELSAYVPGESTLRLQSVLEEELSLRFGRHYAGYLGVDMMLCRFPGSAPEFRIHPCVEINLRMNMGVVAHMLYDRYVAPSSCGRFSITYHPAPHEALKDHERMRSEYPLEIENDKIVSGYLPLVPVHRWTSYGALVKIERIS